MIEQGKISLTFGIREVKTLKFLINNIQEAYSLSKEKFQFQIFPASFYSYEDKVIGFDIIIAVFIDEEKKKQICELIVRISFSIINLYDLVSEKNKNSPKIPDHFLQTLLSIALSTSRGILSSKTEGSVLEGVYLPVLNPASFKPVESAQKEK